MKSCAAPEMANAAAKTTPIVAREGLAEVQVLKVGHQYLAQGDAARRAMAGDRIGMGDVTRIDGHQRAHAFGIEVRTAVAGAARACECVEQPRRQALVQGAAARRADVHAIALQPIGHGPLALIDRAADAGLLQTLRETQAAYAAADDEHMPGRRPRGEALAAIRNCHGKPPGLNVQNKPARCRR
jgi:hypothetical protein